MAAVAAEIPESVYVEYELLRIRCGKDRCRCNTSDQSAWHGPYWYAYWRDPSSRRQRSRYMGKHFSPPTRKAAPAGGAGAHVFGEAPDDELQSRRQRKARAQEQQARARAQEQARARAQEQARRHHDQRHRGDEHQQHQQRAHAYAPRPNQDEVDAAALGVTIGVGKDELKRAWKRKIATAHPDRYPEGAERTRQEEIAKTINQAYQRMKKRRGW